LLQQLQLPGVQMHAPPVLQPTQHVQLPAVQPQDDAPAVAEPPQQLPFAADVVALAGHLLQQLQLPGVQMHAPPVLQPTQHVQLPAVQPQDDTLAAGAAAGAAFALAVPPPPQVQSAPHPHSAPHVHLTSLHMSGTTSK